MSQIGTPVTSDTPVARLDSLSAGLLDRLERDDPAVAGLLAAEAERQASTLELIASENHVSHTVMLTVGSWLTNK
ncbi:MAG: serine hydroxymethyltransferase, partial [Phycisphaerales bacterium]